MEWIVRSLYLYALYALCLPACLLTMLPPPHLSAMPMPYAAVYNSLGRMVDQAGAKHRLARTRARACDGAFLFYYARCARASCTFNAMPFCRACNFVYAPGSLRAPAFMRARISLRFALFAFARFAHAYALPACTARALHTLRALFARNVTLPYCCLDLLTWVSGSGL